jgi:hypothetical protein
MIGIVPVYATLPTSLSIDGSTLGVSQPTGPLITGVLTTSTGFPLSDRIIFFEASVNGEFPGTQASVVGRAVTNKNGEVRFRPSSFAHGPYFRALYPGDGTYAGTKSDIIEISSLLEEARVARAQEGPGNLNIFSTPANADIYIDGLLAGKTNTIIKGIPSGERDVTLVLDGYLDSTYSVLITSKKTVSLVVTLTPFTPPSDSALTAFTLSTQNMELLAGITGGPASYQLYQNTSDPASIPHSVNVIEFSDPRSTSYIVVVSPQY